MKAEKKFDAVKMMRDARSKLSEEFQGMSYSEQKKNIKGMLKPKGGKDVRSFKQRHPSTVK